MRKSVRKGAKNATLHFHCRNCFTYNAIEKHRVCTHAKKFTTRKLLMEKVGKTDSYLQCSIVDVDKCIYLVRSALSGPEKPVHVQLK